jgi:hypothetical protein
MRALASGGPARGEFERGEASRITRLPDPSARRVLKSLTDECLLASITDKGAVWLRFPVQALETFSLVSIPRARG